MPPRTRNLNVVVGADTRPLKRGLDDGTRSVNKFAKSTEDAGKRAHRGFSLITPATTAAVAGIGGVAIGLKTVISAAADSEKSNARLAAQLKASGISYKTHAKEIDNVIQKTSKLAALDDEDLQDAFTNIIRTTGSVSKSMKLVGVAADLARAKHLDVAKAGEIVAKVAGGNTGVLSRYGISIEKGATATEALAALQKKFAGQAEAYGKTTAGAQERFGNAVENLEEKLGGALLPTVTKVTDKAAKFVEQINDGTGAGGRFADKVSQIAHDVEPVAKDFASAASAVAKFTGKHPDIVKVGAAVVGVGIALKGLKFVSAATGFTDLVKAGRAATSTLVKVLGRAGAQGGAAVSANAAETLASNIDGSVSARKGRIRSALQAVFKTAGVSAGQTASANAADSAANRIDDSLGARRGKFAAAGKSLGGTLGKSLGVAAVAIAGFELAQYLSKLNDQLSKKGGIEGILGKVSNVGEWIVTHTRGAGAVPDKRAGGGRVPGPRVAADTVPALLSPQEFVVTGDGERTLESMTFPGVLDWLQGAQAPHFQGGGRVAPNVSTAWRFMRGNGASAAQAAGAIGVMQGESGLGLSPTATNPGSGAFGIAQWLGSRKSNLMGKPNPSSLGTQLGFMWSELHGSEGAAYRKWKGASSIDAAVNAWLFGYERPGPGEAKVPLRLGYARNVFKALSDVKGGGASSTGASERSGTSIDRTPLAAQDYIFAGFQAAAEGTSLRSFLGPALENVGTVSSSGSGATASATSTSMSRAGLQLPASIHRTHDTLGLPGYPAQDIFAKPGTTVGSPVTGVVTKLSGQAGGPGGGGAYGYSVYISGGGKSYFLTHLGSRRVKVGQRVTRGQVIGTVADYPDRPDHIHEGVHGRRGGRIARLFGGGRAGRRNTGTVRSYLPGGLGRMTGRDNRASISSLLNRIATGSPAQVQQALRSAQTIMAAHPTLGSLRAYINAANRRSEGRVSTTGRRGLQSFVALAQAELGRQIQNPILGVEAAEGGFDQSNTDLQNQLAADRATDAQTAGALGAQSTTQLNQLYQDRAVIVQQLNRARKSGSRKTVAALQTRLSAQDSAILAKRAEIVGYQDQYTAAMSPDGLGGDDATQAMQELAQAIQAHTDAITANTTALQQQTQFAQAVSSTSASTLAQTLADVVSGQIAGGLTRRRFTAGVGTVAAY